MSSTSGPRRRFLVPEVVQTSSMDCGPAALACLLAGFGIRASYGRLREACQTDVDGTSIDTVEEAALALGLQAEQLLVPLEHLFLREAEVLPALVVVQQASGARHFVVAWRRSGGLVQVMDPAVGRRWLGARALLDQVYAHRMELPASTWRAWMAHPFHRDPLQARLERLGFPRREARERIERGLAEGHWKPCAALQASLGLAERLERARAVRRGAEGRALLAELYEHAREDDPATSPHVPLSFWPVQPAPAKGAEVSDDPLLRVHGAVAVRVRGRRARSAATAGVERPAASEAREPARASAAEPPLSPELAAALEEAPLRPLRELWKVLKQDGALAPAVVLGALGAASAAVFAQALLLRGLLELAHELGSDLLRLGAAVALLAFFAFLLALELALTSGLVRLGRHLEGRMRVLFQEKLPRLGERYFHSRPAADMTERVHAGTGVRAAPSIGAQLLRALFGLALTTLGLAWIAPEVAGIALVSALIALAVPLASQRLLGERELRARSQRAALGRFYLDGLLGVVAVRTHGAERVLRREHEALLTEWVRAARRFLSASIGVETLGALAGYALALWILFAHVAAHSGAGGASFPPGLLLVCFWALALPAQGQTLALLAQQIPAQRNVALRILEPLGAPEDSLATRTEALPQRKAAAAANAPTLETRTSLRAAGAHLAAERVRDEREELGESARPLRSAADPDRGRERAARPLVRGVALAWRGVSVVAAGRTILSAIELEVRAGEHVAIVGRSGAGKSSLLGLLLGWHRAARGELLVDGVRLDGAALAALRRSLAWVDPSVQVWNRSLLANLVYGSGASPAALGEALRAARLTEVLAALPAGLATRLGQGGGLVSGGEGQRVRLARAFSRSGVRLALLDEPFCGLERDSRRALLAESRSRWREATLLCATHDVADTLDFERVIVMDGGRLVESGSPGELLCRAGSPYRALVEADELARRTVWGAGHWERWRVAGGSVRTARADEGAGT